MKAIRILYKSQLTGFFIFFLIINSSFSFSQISQKGVPWSFIYVDQLSKINYVHVSPPEISDLLDEDTEAIKNGTFYRFGKLLPVEFDIEDGVWSFLGNGDRIWQLKITCKNAHALSLYFNNFNIPPGGKLYIYKVDHSQILGAYTEFNNTESGIFATQLVFSDELIIEYNEYSNPYGKVDFSISDIGYAYRGIYRNRNIFRDFGASESCEVNVNCSPEGNNWQNQKRGAVRVSLVSGGNMGWCSGSLINNTANDCTPYILTADHCGGDATPAEYQQWVFYFNYESPDCTNPVSEGTLASETMSGCTLTAHGGQGGTAGSDFQLVECNNPIPESYNPYYNGWNRENIGSSSGVSIHHPAGDIKKISTFTSQLTTTDWNGSGYESHWNVTWVATTNGHGVTEGGSSGSPIFDNSGLIVGDLTGGSSYCNTPNAPDMYGKISYSWESNGSLPEEQLKPWLDPLNTGALTHQGMNFCGSTGLYADFSFLPAIGVTGVPVDFTDLSLGSINSWLWEFQNGNPANSTIQNPTGIIYNIAGVYNVTLTISNGLGSDTQIKQINVIPPSPPTADFVASETQIYVGDTINFLDLSTGGPTHWDWTFIGGTPFSSSAQNPIGIIYNSPGTFSVSLSLTNAYGDDFNTKSNYIEVLEGTPVIEFCDTLSNLESFDSLMTLQMQPWGLLPGHNPLYITEYADLHATPDYDFVRGFLVPIQISSSSINSAMVKFKIWDYNIIPGALLGFKEIYLSQLVPNTYQLVLFDNDINVYGSFFVGYGITYYITDNYSGPNNFATFMANDRGALGNNTLFVNYNNTWFNASEFGLLNNIHTSLGIEPIACSFDNIDLLNNDNFDVRIYPNPTNDKFHILTDNKYDEIDISVYNSMGQRVLCDLQLDLNKYTIDMTGNNPGIYFIYIVADGFVKVQKVSLL